MTRRDMTQTTSGRIIRGVAGTFPDRSRARLLAIADEWLSRRDIERGLGRLSDFHLRDVGLTKADVEAARAQGFDQPASRGLKRTARNRAGNW